MALVWKAKYGYSKKEEAEFYYNLTSLSQIIFTDNSYFTIANHYYGDFDLPIVSSPSYVGPTLSQFEGETKLINIMGDDYYTMYLLAGDSYANYARIIALLPNSFRMCPNLISDIISNTANKSCLVVYFETLKRVIAYSGLNNYIYRVNDDGGLERLMSSTLMFEYLFPLGGQSATYPIIKYSGPADLTDSSKWIAFRAFANTDQFRFMYLLDPGGGLSAQLATFFGNNGPDYIDKFPPSDPYEPSTPSGPGDLPPGTFDDTSDIISVPPLPTISAANTGFTRIYNPTLSQVQALARYLWTEESVVATLWNKIKQYFEDPMQAIIGFNLVPCPVPDGGTQEFALMYIGTGVTMTVAANQFVDVDCGTLDLERYYGSALDQSPYTKIHCFLPYIGTVRLNTDEVMGTTLHIIYRIDIVTGSCVAMVLVDDSVLYQYSGHCAINIPISSADFSSYVSAAINVAKTAAAGVAMGVGMGALAAGVGAESAATQATTPPPLALPSSTPAIAPGSSSPANYSPPVDFPTQGGGTPGSFRNIGTWNPANTVGMVTGGKPYIEHSGSFSGNSGYLGVRRPFVIIERPNMCLPENYQALNGYPAMITMELGSCSGFTKIQQVQLTGCSATNPEQDEIMSLLKVGVIF